MLHCVIKTFEELTTHELYEILSLRCKVFVVEQHCAYLDTDGYDKDVIHLMFYYDKVLVGYTRVFKYGVKYKDACAISRVVLDKEYRLKGWGYEIVKTTIAYIKKNMGDVLIRISAQSHLKKFYGNFGFKICSSMYLEDDIPHFEMKLEM
jgi:ElaA protein